MTNYKSGALFDFKQFHNCQCGCKRVNARFDILQSYWTDIAIVDNKTHEIYCGEYARGFSRTTSKQFGRMVGEWYFGYDIIERHSVANDEFMRVFEIPEYWDDYNKACWVSWGNLNGEIGLTNI